MRRIKSEYYKSLSGFKPNFYAVPARDYRLMRAVVKASETVTRLAKDGPVASGMFVGLARALDALNAPGNGRR